MLCPLVEKLTFPLLPHLSNHLQESKEITSSSGYRRLCDTPYNSTGPSALLHRKREALCMMWHWETVACTGLFFHFLQPNRAAGEKWKESKYMHWSANAVWFKVKCGVSSGGAAVLIIIFWQGGSPPDRTHRLALSAIGNRLADSFPSCPMPCTWAKCWLVPFKPANAAR